jgi:3-oxoacyl-[acyl-carrier protein] reductase
VAAVAGGAGGIGRAICEALMAAGARVVSVDRAGQPGPAGTATIACDLTTSDDVRAALESVVREHGRLDVVVHAAGITRDGFLAKLSDEDWDSVLATNLTSGFYLVRSAMPALREAGGGSIVLVSSINGERGKAGQANYAASKAGLIGMSKSIARELASRGITVNVIAPGFIETDMTSVLSEEIRKGALSQIPLSKFGQGEDIAAAVAFFASSEASFITGQVLAVDGGMSM